MTPRVSQREVYILPFPDQIYNGEDRHPFIVLSAGAANDNADNTFIGVMMTSSAERIDDNSFHLTDDMFITPLPKSNCHVRMHLITLCIKGDITRDRVNMMKERHFHQLMKSIGEQIFNYSFDKLS